MEQCWWCGDIANTREHKIKKSIINQLMFKDCSGAQPKIKNKTKTQIIQSPDSCFLKYKKNLCEACNTSKSQNFDRAYDSFFNFIITHEKLVASSLKINMKALGINQEDLFRYFIKSFCCMIDSTKYSDKPPLFVPSELIDALNGNDYSKSLVLQFYTNEEPTKYPLKRIINVTDPIYTPISNGTYSFHYFETFGWLHICYIYQTIKHKSEYKRVLKETAPNYWVGKSKLIIIDKISSIKVFQE